MKKNGRERPPATGFADRNNFRLSVKRIDTNEKRKYYIL
jgi:hypothetical protein